MRETRAWRFFWGVTAYPRTVLSASLALIAVSLLALPQLTRDTRSEAFIPADHPAVVYREKVREIFGLSDPIVVAVVNAGPHGVFNPDTLRLIDHLTREIADLPNVDSDRVTSLATENDIVGTEDGMLVDPFFEEPPDTQAEATRIRNAVLGFDLYVGSLVSEDGSATLIIAELLDGRLGEEVHEQVLAIVARSEYGSEEIHVAGEGAVVAKLGSYIDADAARLNPFSALLITMILIVAYRTLRGVLLPNLVVLGAVAFALGSMSVLGVPIYVITNALPPLLIAVAVADSIHILGQYYEEVADNPEASSRELAVRSMTQMWRPITVTTVTDIAGFLAIASSSFMPPMRAFGVFASVGVGGALLLSLFTLPAALTLLRPQSSRAFGTRERFEIDRFGRWMGAIGEGVLRWPRAVVAIGALVTVAGAFGATMLKVDEARIENFHPSDPLYKADRAINERLSGTSYVDFVIETQNPEDLFKPENLRRIERLQRTLEQYPRVASTTSIVDYIKQMHRAMNEDRESFYRIPDSADLVAQYFLLYSISGNPTDFEKEVDYDYRLANVRVAMTSGRFSHGRVVIEGAERYIEEEFNAPGIRASISGRVNVDYHLGQSLTRSHFLGMALALFAVWCMASLCFRSFAAGSLAVVPVTMSILLIYAVMGSFGIWLGVGTTMFAAIAIGTGIDFAVHTLDRLIASTRDQGQQLEPALRALYPSTGRALFFSFTALLLGFGVLTTSYVPTLVRFGALVGVAVATAFVASLTLLPALALFLRPRFLQPAEGTLQKASGIGRAACLALSVGLLGALSAAADDASPEEWPSGDEIARLIDERDEGERVTQRLSMELIDRRGKSRKRETIGYRKYYGEERRTVLFYETPKNVKGTAFLTIDHPEPDRDDDQWLYLPALRKVRRISASDRGDAFLGTDFSYDDMKKAGKLSLEDYRQTTIGVEVVDERKCFVLELFPVSEEVSRELGYGRVVAYVDPEMWMSRRTEFWDLKGKPLKTIYAREIRRVDGIWTAHQFEATNHKTGHRTIFTFSNMDYESAVDDALFTERALRHGP